MYVHVCTCRIDSDLKKKNHYTIMTYIHMHVCTVYILQLLSYIRILGNWNCMYVCVCVCVYLTNVHLHETCTIDHVRIYHCTNSYIHTRTCISTNSSTCTRTCAWPYCMSIGEINSHGTYVIIAQRLSYNFLNMH